MKVFDAARAGDVAALAAIDASSPTPWTEEAFRAEVGHVPPTVFVLSEDHVPLAFVVTRFQHPEMDIINVAVDTAHRRRGLGRALLQSLFDFVADTGIATVFLEVRAGNAAAIGLYRKLGFTETQRRRAFYKAPIEDAVLMRIPLTPNRG